MIQFIHLEMGFASLLRLRAMPLQAQELAAEHEALRAPRARVEQASAQNETTAGFP